MSEPLTPIGAGIGETLRKLGVPDLAVVTTLVEQWDRLAGEPWSGNSRPVMLRDGELVVAASSGPAVGLLRYAVGELIQRLDEAFGPGVVEVVRVTGPERPARGG